MSEELENWHLYGKSGPPEKPHFVELWDRDDDRAIMLMWQRDSSSPEEWTAAIHRPGEAKTPHCWWNNAGRLFHPMPPPNPPPKPPPGTFESAVDHYVAENAERAGRVFPSRETCRKYIESICPLAMD